MSKSNIKFIPVQSISVTVHVCFVLVIVCLYICICDVYFKTIIIKQKNKNKTNGGSAFEPGASGLPDYLYFFGFESTQLARRLHQERTQMEAQ